MNGPFLHGSSEFEMKTQLLVNFAAEDGIRQHSKSNDFDQWGIRSLTSSSLALTQSESVGNTVRTIHDCFRHIFRQNDSKISLSANQRVQE